MYFNTLTHNYYSNNVCEFGSVLCVESRTLFGTQYEQSSVFFHFEDVKFFLKINVLYFVKLQVPIYKLRVFF